MNEVLLTYFRLTLIPMPYTVLKYISLCYNDIFNLINRFS